MRRNKYFISVAGILAGLIIAPGRVDAKQEDQKTANRYVLTSPVDSRCDPSDGKLAYANWFVTPNPLTEIPPFALSYIDRVFHIEPLTEVGFHLPQNILSREVELAQEILDAASRDCKAKSDLRSRTPTGYRPPELRI